MACEKDEIGGRSFIIRRRGKAVAKLVPPDREDEAISVGEVLASFRKIRKRIGKKINIRKLIEEGRRF